jgi:hypothetical protein
MLGASPARLIDHDKTTCLGVLWMEGLPKEFWRIEFPEDSFLCGSLVHREGKGIIPEDSVPMAYFTGNEA